MAFRELESAFVPAFLQFKRNYQYSKVFDLFRASGNLTFLRHDDPKEILTTMCRDVLGHNAITLININNPQLGERPSANNYILEVAQTLGLPVISWDAEFSGSPKDPRESLALQIAPTIQHQARAIFSLLQRYNWTQFSVVTTRVSGHLQFLSELRDITRATHRHSQVTISGRRQKSFKILQEILVNDWRNTTEVKYELNKLSGTDTRIIILHAGSGGECYTVMETAAVLGLTGRQYQWILTQTAISISKHAHSSFPIGTLGLTYDHDIEAMKQALRMAVKVWFTALNDLAQRPADLNNTITFPSRPRVCDASEADLKWADGRKMYKALQNIRIPRDPQIRFDGNGTLRQTELAIINCRWNDNEANSKRWQEVGRWLRHGLSMRDIVWPGGSSVPPSGMPARAFLRIATLQEKPYVMYLPPNSNGKCSDHAVHCRIYQRDDEKRKLSNTTIPMCCIGLSIDLLRVFSRELNFDYDLFEVDDGMWGAIDKATGRWNGPIKMLLDHEADMVVTSLKINPDRNSAVRFSVPFLETGITIVVSLREGAISPTAFLEPYDYPSWCLILVFSVHATGASIFIFEWLSPYGLNRGKSFFPDHKFSLFRSFWMIWAMLFSAAVDTDMPRGVSSRFLANIWALFALVFLASYTANLAAFMITKEEYYDLSGIQDWRLQNPTHTKPPFKYATVPEGSTETNIRNNHPKMYNYMKHYNKPDVTIGVEAVKSGEIQAFIYDATVLEYYVGKDPGCRLRTVGNWYAMTGYGVAFPPGGNNPWIDKINKVIFQLLENGEMERLQKFWLAGACYFEKDKKGVSNKTLGILNFTSAFILLGGGVLLSLVLLLLEFFYFRFGRRCLVRANSCRFCGLISLNLGQSLTMKETVEGTVQLQKRCRDQLCDTQIWRLKHQLDLALLKIENLQNQISSGARRYTEPDITRQVGHQDSDYSQYNGAARRHPSRDDFYQSDRLLDDENCDSRSEGGGMWRIRRSPSYTCAIGGDLMTDTSRLSNKSRQHEGRLYVGVDSSANSSESVM
ncbi:glutamate receptor ionotropic, NMDA 2B-like [Babylonia areolata]|uniref:glutamate receptor ionotropic, NMDA 2B-like n=1 Tax=Babylonia areolata TaxID=304850 RepID=UPI003FD615DA